MLISWLIGSLIGGLIGALLFGLSGPEIDIKRRTKPNQGIWESGNKAVLFTLLSGVIYTISFSLTGQIRGITFEPIERVIDGLGAGVFFGIIYGGKACIQHFILRLILWQHGDIPWNYAKFLNYASERLFLQRIGGRYRFIHDLLREHFAKM